MGCRLDSAIKCATRVKNKGSPTCLSLRSVVVVVVVVVFDAIFQTECVCPHSGELIGRPGAKSPGSQTPGDSGTPGSPRALTGVSAKRLEKLALNSGIAGGARKMTQNASKSPSSPPKMLKTSYPAVLHN